MEWRDVVGKCRAEMKEDQVKASIIGNPALADGSFIRGMDRVGAWAAALRPEVLDQDMGEVLRAKDLLDQAVACGHAACGRR